MAGQDATLPGEKESSSSSPFVAAAQKVRSLYPQEAKRPQKKEKAFSPPSAETRRPSDRTLPLIDVITNRRRLPSCTGTAARGFSAVIPEQWPTRTSRGRARLGIHGDVQRAVLSAIGPCAFVPGVTK